MDEHKELFSTDAEKANAVAQFQSLKEHFGWQLIVRVIQENIKVLEKQLKEGVGNEETLADIQRLRDKIADHEAFINTPDNLIKDFTATESDVPDDDPYDKAKPIT